MHYTLARREISASTCRKFLTAAVVALAAALVAGPRAHAQVVVTPNVVISQVYTRGGEPGATYSHDYVVLFNRGTSQIDLNGWSLHVRSTEGNSASSSFVSFVSSRSILIEPGRYLLVQLAGGAEGQPLPAADFSVPPMRLGSTSGQIALVRRGGSFPALGCPSLPSSDVADFVGYGAAACHEGNGPAPAPSSGASAIHRTLAGCVDEGSNASDFHLGTPVPHHSASPGNLCGSPFSPSYVQFERAVYAAGEGAGRAEVAVTRTGDLSGEAVVEYIVADQTASQRQDYTTARGRLRFAPGESRKTFEVLITDDAYVEPDEQAGMVLASMTSGARLGTPAGAQLVITDNDSATAAANPVDDARFFVRQHYHDFFNREPDAAGLSFWADNLSSCGGGCAEVKRIDTSAAFFLSIEFDGTGFLVYRLYKAAFPERQGRPRALPRYAEFMRDTREVGRGVVVGEAGWEERLEANTRAFLDEFVSRPEFTANYPARLTHAEFVDKLNAQAGGPLSADERDRLVAGLAAGAETRASALRRVAEDTDFRRAELNRAFVLMQYFGYLRRNPDDAPDADFAGYDFWLGKLEEFGGDYRAAEMVKGFINSGEYRARFAPPQ